MMAEKSYEAITIQLTDQSIIAGSLNTQSVSKATGVGPSDRPNSSASEASRAVLPGLGFSTMQNSVVPAPCGLCGVSMPT